MIERTIARRYAASMLEVSDQAKATEEVEALLLALKEAFLRDETVRSTLVNPRFPRKEKKALLRRALGAHAPPILLGFLDVLVDKDRIRLLPHVADAFDELADQSAGVVRVEVRSFRPLEPAQEASLRERLIRLVGGKKIKVEAKVDPGLRGGLWVRIGDTLIDGSVDTRLKQIRERLLELRAV